MCALRISVGILLHGMCMIAGAVADKPSPKIAIVGAGMSGLSAAHHLTKAGFRDITIFEKSHQVGGVISTTKYSGISTDMSTYGLTPIYWRFRKAMEELGAEFCPFESSIVIPGESRKETTLVNARKFISGVSASSLESPSTFAEQFLLQVKRYAQLWTTLFDVPYLENNNKFEAERLFPSKMPSDKKTLAKLAMPMLDFLRKEGLELLIPLFRAVTNTQGYGPVETTAAVYVMSWAGPSIFIPGSKTTRPCGIYNSFQLLADRLAESLRDKVTFRFGVHVEQVRRANKGKVRIVLKSGRAEWFDKVFVTLKLPEAHNDENIVKPFSWLEFWLARRVQSLEIYTALLEGSRKNVVGKDKFLLYDSDIVTMAVAKEEAFIALTYEAGTNGQIPADKTKIARGGGLMFYKQQSEGRCVKVPDKEKDEFILKKISKWDDTNWEVLEGHSFRSYFQRWTPKYVRKGFPWAVNRIQGSGGVYLISSYVCGMESVAHLFDCAKHLVDKYFK